MYMAFVPVDLYAGPHHTVGPAFASVGPRPVPPAGAPIDVLVAHPEPTRLDALHRSLGRGDRVTVVARAANGADARAAVARLHPAVMVIDDRLPGWRRMARHTRIVLLTGETNPRALGMLLHDPASAYLSYDQFEPADLLGAVHAVADGLAWLSPVAASAATAAMRESARPAAPRRTVRRLPHDQRFTAREQVVLALLGQGLSTPAIAAALALTERTVRNHLNRCYAKLGVRTPAEAVRLLAEV
jgi:DNA-binding NarL/FixJ family response regulator